MEDAKMSAMSSTARASEVRRHLLTQEQKTMLPWRTLPSRRTQAVNQQQWLTMRALLLRKLYAMARYLARCFMLRPFRSTKQDQYLQSKRYHNAKLEHSPGSEKCNGMMQRWLLERPQDEPWHGLACSKMSAKGENGSSRAKK